MVSQRLQQYSQTVKAHALMFCPQLIKGIFSPVGTCCLKTCMVNKLDFMLFRQSLQCDSMILTTLAGHDAEAVVDVGGYLCQETVVEVSLGQQKVIFKSSQVCWQFGMNNHQLPQLSCHLSKQQTTHLCYVYYHFARVCLKCLNVLTRVLM